MLVDLTNTALTPQGLQQIKCPPRLAFDLRKQACDWKATVTDCDQTQKPQLVLPRLNTDEPLCATANELACGDSTCIAKDLFCDGKADCSDSSDENVCGRFCLNSDQSCDACAMRML